MKNGDIYRGTIIELVRGDHIVLLLPSGESRRFDTADVVSAGAVRYDRPPEEAQRAPGAHAHDGFYLRLQLGVGYTHLGASERGTDLSIAGTSYSFGVAAGGAVNSHLIIYGTLISGLDRRPTGSIHGPSLNSVGDGMIAGQVSVGGFGDTSLQAVGAGVASYLESNVFFAGSLLGSRLHVDDISGNTIAKSNWGLTFEALVGKEWWVSENWGLGATGQLLLGAMNDGVYGGGSGPTWTLAKLSVLFSASFN